MAEDARDRVEVDAGCEQQRRGRVPRVMQAELAREPVPKDIVRALPMPLAPSGSSAPSGSPGLSGSLGPAAPIAPSAPPAQSALPAPLGARDLVPAGTGMPPLQHEVVKPLTPELRRLNVTVTADFIDELEQVRVALSHQCPDGTFEQVVREAFKLVLERDRRRKSLTERPRPQSETPGENDRYVPAAVKRTVWKRDQGRCTWPMGDGKVCGSRHRLEFDHDLEVALGGKPTIGNVRLLCKSHNLMKAEQRFGRAFMANFRKEHPERDTSSSPLLISSLTG